MLNQVTLLIHFKIDWISITCTVGGLYKSHRLSSPCLSPSLLGEFTLNYQCLVIFPQRCRFSTNRLNACSFYIGFDRIDFIESFSHLGHIINAKVNDVSDIIKCCNDFIGQVPG